MLDDEKEGLRRSVRKRSGRGVRLRDRRREPLVDEALLYYRRLGRVDRFVHEHLGEEIQVSDVARAAGIAPSYFSTFFHRKTGKRFHRWLTELRVDKSKALLAKRNYSITEVTFAAGFSSLRTFERSFKELTGLTPQEFRRRTRPG